MLVTEDMYITVYVIDNSNEVNKNGESSIIQFLSLLIPLEYSRHMVTNSLGVTM